MTSERLNSRGTHNIPPFTVKAYIRALRQMEYQGELPAKLLTLLRWQATMADGRANAQELALVTGMTLGEVNLIYGGSGKALGSLLTGESPETFVKGWPFWAHGERRDGLFYWFLHPPLQKALQALELLLIEDESPRYAHAVETDLRRRLAQAAKH